MKQQSELEKIAIQELLKGKSPDDIERLAQKTNVSVNVIRDHFASIYHNPKYVGVYFRHKLEKYNRRKKAPKISRWHQFGVAPAQEKLKRRKEHIKKQYERWKSRPWEPILLTLLLFFIPSICLWFLFTDPTYYQYIKTDANFMSTLWLVIPFMFAAGGFLYIFHVRHVQLEMVKMIIAENNSWFYDPNKDYAVYFELYKWFYKLFRKGNYNQNIQDQFWGKYEDIHFWSGIYHYEHRTKVGDNSVSKEYDDHFFALKLDHIYGNELFLKPKKNIQKLFGVSKESLQTESIRFNNYFDASYNALGSTKQIDLFTLLTPTVIVRLADVAEQFGDYSVLIKYDMAFFYFKGRALKNMKTNFYLKGIKLDPRDQKKLEKKIKTILFLTKGLVPNLK